MSDPGNFLAAKRVARSLGVSPRTLWRWVQRGRFPRPVYFGPHVPRWHRSDVARWLRRLVG